MNRKQYRLDRAKGMIRTIEGILELAVLVFVYYYIWRKCYRPLGFPGYNGNGKYVLAGIYGFLTVLLFFNFDGFKFGYLKKGDVFISQVLALFFVNFITYWQLGLIATFVLPLGPIMMIMGIDIVLALIFSLLYNAIYHSIYVPKNMVLIFGNKEAVSLGVALEQQGKGLARKMLSAAMDAARRDGCDSVRFLVAKRNPIAQRSYAKLDFDVCGECEMWGENWLCYQKRL